MSNSLGEDSPPAPVPLRIAFYQQHHYPYTDEDYEGKGVGGTEASIILLARHLALRGHRVSVFNSCGSDRTQRGVRYRDCSDFDTCEALDVLIVVNYNDPKAVASRARAKVYWMHAGIRLPPPGQYHAIVAVSPYHRDQRIDNPTGIQIQVLDLGVNANDYRLQPEKVPGKLLYCSVPTKGVEHLPPIFRRVRDRFPDSKLWITSDMTLWGRESLGPLVRSLFDGIGGVHFLGAIPRAELVFHQRTAEVMAYPVQAPEHFCISAMECMAAGTVPVTTRRGAMETTVGDYGILVSGDPHGEDFREQFAESIVGLLSDRERLRDLAVRGRQRALEQFSWSTLVVSQWEPFLHTLLGTAERHVSHNLSEGS